MSTWIYLQCLDHNPPLEAEDESGQHLYDLPQIRADVDDREFLVRAMRNGADFGYFRNNTVKFLAQHENCHIGIVDEYGRSWPLDGGDDDEGVSYSN